MRVTFIIALLLLNACADSKFPEFHEYESWVEENEANLLELRKLLQEKEEVDRIWTKGDVHEFEVFKDGEYVVVEPVERSAYVNILTKGGSVVYINNDTGLFVSAARTSKCFGVDCDISAVQFKHENPYEGCTKELLSVPSTTCSVPLLKEWFLVYETFK